MRYYTREHLWLEIEDGGVKLGLTSHGVSSLRKITYLEFSQSVPARVVRGMPLAVLESAKIVWELPSPLAGRLIEYNPAFPDHLEWLNDSPELAGWLCRFDDVDLSGSGLLSEPEYSKLTGAGR